MKDGFLSLVDSALSEIERRDRAYLRRYPLRLASPAAVTEGYRAVNPDFLSAPLAAALYEGAMRLTASGSAFIDPDGVGDPLSDIMFDSIVDAFYAEQGRLALTNPVAPPALEHALASQFEERRGPNGTRYFFRTRGKVPLLLLSATGIPLQTWGNLICDASHNFRIILVESPGGDLVTGGVEQLCDLARDVENIREVLRHEAVQDLGVVGWCNGAKLALALAQQSPELVRWMMLLSPALRTIRSAVPAVPTFESNFAKVAFSLRQSSDLAPVFIDILMGQREPPAWEKLAGSTERANALFPLPPSDEAPGLMAPMRTAETLLSYCRRIESEIQFDVSRALQDLRCPLMLMTGSHDNMVDNKSARDLLRQNLRAELTEVEVNGAGHYIHSLQYPYFLCALTAFAARTPIALARRMQVTRNPMD